MQLKDGMKNSLSRLNNGDGKHGGRTAVWTSD